MLVTKLITASLLALKSQPVRWQAKLHVQKSGAHGTPRTYCRPNYDQARTTADWKIWSR